MRTKSFFGALFSLSAAMVLLTGAASSQQPAAKADDFPTTITRIFNQGGKTVVIELKGDKPVPEGWGEDAVDPDAPGEEEEELPVHPHIVEMLAGEDEKFPWHPLPSGGRYRDIIVGPEEGEPIVKDMQVFYYLKIYYPDGRLFGDSLTERTVVRHVIGSWMMPKEFDAALESMKPRGRRLIVLPAETDYTNTIYIPLSEVSKETDLIFEVTLLRVRDYNHGQRIANHP